MDAPLIRIIQLRGPLWGIQSSSFSPYLRDECKATPGMVWEPISKSWVGYADAVAVAAKRARARGLRIINPPGPIGTGIGLNTMPVASVGLRDYQKVGVDFLLAKAGEGAILADDMGLGKTSQAITAARAIKQKTIVVCPSFVRGVWLDQELGKWWPAARVIGLSGTKPDAFIPIGKKAPDGSLAIHLSDPQAEKIDVAVIHYDVLYAWVDALIAWGAKVLIIDELHYAMGHASRRTKALRKLAATCPYRIGLTGTPMTSRPRDLWAPIEVVSPGRFGKFFNFGIRFCDGHQEQVTPTKTVWKFDGASNLEELNERLSFEPKERPWGCMLRRLKSEVALELPARQRQILTVEVAKGCVMAPSAAVRSDRILRQALNMAADGKFPQVIDLACSHLDEGHKVVVGTYRREVAEMIAAGVGQKHPWKIEIITGDIPLAKRNAIIKSQPDLICCTLDSTKEGINLSFASVGIIAELVWVPSTLAQWEARFGRHEGKNILIQYVIARGTADDIVRRTVINKLDSFGKVVGGTDDKLFEDLNAGRGDAAARMQALYERLKKEDE